MKKHCGFSNIQENTSSIMLPNFDFRQVTTIFSVLIIPAILVFAKRFSTNHRKENIIYIANREPGSLLISSYQLLCDHYRFNQQ